MSNYLKVTKREQVIALLGLGWTYRRIEAETSVRRETVSKYDRLRRAKAAKVFAGSGGAEGSSGGGSGGEPASNPAEVFPGVESNPAEVFPGAELPPRHAAASHRTEILAKLQAGLTAQRIWQDLVEDFGYGASYESVKRYVRTLKKDRRVVGVMHSAPGEEAQVDFFHGPPTLHEQTGQWRRPWVFRMTLCHSRHGYEEAVWEQKLETFLRLHERAFHALGGAPQVVRHDNLKAAVVRACLYDPDSNAVYLAFAEHWGFAALPTRPRSPQENGKQERSGGYVKDNALRGRRFDGLAELNAFLRHWNETIARQRIHGTTRRQVWQHYLETDKPALQPLAAEPFAYFRCGDRIVHTDGHVEVDGAFYPVPVHLLGEKVQVRWDSRLVRVFHRDQLVAVYAHLAPGRFAVPPGGSAESLVSSQRAALDRLLARTQSVGPELKAWAEAAFEERGIRCLRLIQGVLALLRRHPKEQLLAVAGLATERRLFRYKDIARLLEQRALARVQPLLISEHELIRPLSAYTVEDLL